MMTPKLNLSECIRWDHHRSGWGFCIDSLKPLHNPCGVLMVGYIEQYIRNDIEIKQDWVGFVHNAVKHPSIISKLYGKKNDLDLTKIVETPIWHKNLSRCKGIFCLSSDNAEFLKQHTDVPVEVVYHTTEIPNLKFSPSRFLSNSSKKVITIGHWMRNFQAIFDLDSIYDKFILRGVGNAFRYDKLIHSNESVSYLERLTNEEYDVVLSENLVFLNLYGSSANNTVVECIARNTPIIVNRLPALEEYLGKDYPLFYDTIEEASILLKDMSKIIDAYNCLKGIDKIESGNFLNSVYMSDIYDSLYLVKMI